MSNTQLIEHQHQGVQIWQRGTDGYINATGMAKAHLADTNQRRDVSEWLSNSRIQESIKHLSLKTGIPAFKLVESKKGRYGGTWIHPKLAIRFGIWLSDDFGYLIEDWVEEWMTTGQNPIAQPPKSLPGPTVEERINMLKDSFQFFGLNDSPRHMQLVKDHVGNLLAGDQKALPPGEVQWQGVAEIAEEAGFNAYDVSKISSSLGKAVAKWYRDTTKTKPHKEKRFVNGTNRFIGVYQPTKELTDFIVSFCEAKGCRRSLPEAG